MTNRKKPLSWAVIWTLALWLLGTNLSGAASTPAAWQIKSGDTTVYLMGSMHFGHENFYPLPPALLQAFDRSDVLAVEVDIAGQDSATAMQAMIRHGRLAAGKTLASELDPGTWKLLRDRADSLGLPIAALNEWKPWFAAIQLVGLQLNKSSFDQQLGIDLFFLRRAQGKRVDQLETLDQQLSLFDGVSKKEQHEFLRQTLRDFDKGEAYLLEMARAWRSGDVSALEEIVIAPFRNNHQMSELFSKLMTERNHRMTDAVQSYLEQRRAVFVVVGAAHLLGEDGVVQRLQEKGYTVERIGGAEAEDRPGANKKIGSPAIELDDSRKP